MLLALLIKTTRLVLAVSVSVWMAGGCLFGCSSGSAMAAENSHEAHEYSPHETVAPAVSGESCDTDRSHDCCTKPQAQTRVNRTAKAATSQRTPKDALASVPHQMKDCPLVVNATAVPAKSSGNLPDPGRAPVSAAPRIESRSEQSPGPIGPSYLPNRGPTHLRCCVFLI